VWCVCGVCVCVYASEFVMKRAVSMTIHINIGYLMYHRFQNCALLGYYAAGSGNSLQTFRDNIGPNFKFQESKKEIARVPELLTFCVPCTLLSAW